MTTTDDVVIEATVEYSPQAVDKFEQGMHAGFVDSSVKVNERYRPALIANNKSFGTNLLSVLKSEFRDCESFDLCVAFVSESGLQPLVDVLSELKHRGIRGRLLTSTYLSFNSPATFRKLLEYENIDVRVYQGSLHAKGYIFDKAGISTVVVGSSNLTQSALTCNKEWNVLFRSFSGGEVLQRLRMEFSELWDDDLTEEVTPQWIAEYERYRSECSSPRQTMATYEGMPARATPSSHIAPNPMQVQALEALVLLHARDEKRALLISATGTGKTYLSAFDVLEVKPQRILFLAHRERILSASMLSYQNLLGNSYSYGIYRAGMAELPTCMFAMCSTLVKHLGEFEPSLFDYVVVDEAHRTGSASYQRILDYLSPKFVLGMTATPNRTDGYDVFALFNHVIAFKITLQDALENDMLVPFHYFGIADIEIDDDDSGAGRDRPEVFSKLTSDERVRLISEKLEEYTVDKSVRHGLIFCSSNAEAEVLSHKLNDRGYRTLAISGHTPEQGRDDAISQLESGALQYLLSVDILNEGVDIPTVNQIIMLRRTDSSIVFVQQLGRGLRKAANKEYTLVLDFIGNYQNNFLIPIALSGDKSYNKDTLRAIVKQGSTIIPGSSTISFDRISEERIYRAIDGGKFSSARLIVDEYNNLRQMLGHIPSLAEFDEHGAIDPLLLFSKFGSYHAFLARKEKDYAVRFTTNQERFLEIVSQKMASGKRREDLLVLRELVEAQLCGVGHSIDPSVRQRRADTMSAVSMLTGTFGNRHNEARFPLVQMRDGLIVLSHELCRALDASKEFGRQLREVIAFGLARNERFYSNTYGDTELVLDRKYTYEEVCYLLNWDKNVNAQNIGGYKFDEPTKTFPIFINYEKSPDISDTIRYEDRFVSESELIAISKQPRNLESPEIVRLREWPGNGLRPYLFVRKNKDDGNSKEFYFLGSVHPTGEFRQITMPGTTKTAVEITYELDVPVRHDLYEFITSNEEVGRETA